MKKSKATRLVKELRSGSYSQGMSLLVDSEDNFCCLGVACNISSADLDWTEDSSGDWYMASKYGELPKKVQKEFGFASPEGARRDGDKLSIGGIEYQSLAMANDGGCTFDEIADYIETNYLEL